MNFHKPTPESFELIISGSFDELKFLVEEPDFDINEGDEDDLSALHLAVELNKEDIIRLLLENGAKINAYTFELKLTPLHIAVRNNLIQVVDLLLANEADINFRNKLEHTPLHVAVSTNNIEMARLLLFWGADPNIRTSDPRKETPLTKAATISWQLTSLLLDSGAVLSNESKELHVAILANKPDIANKILSHMKPPYNLLPNRIGKTPLQSVASHITNCDPSVAVNLMTRLIAMGDNVNYVNHFGSVLHILISRGSQDLISSACFDYILSVPDRDCDLIAPSLGSAPRSGISFESV
ncbi:Serine/threonine-protein phosphatase 6 regulatory ankyrin repeat subunit B [Halotydeus destructor]|nr:Serine/threonine-protein phosphatase 6 regulatory ankyrin repeat subunit B [Halotydeus destructor]